MDMKNLGAAIILMPFIFWVSGMSGCTASTSEDHLKASNLFVDPKVVALAQSLERTDLSKAEQFLRDGVDVNVIGKDGITLPLWTMLVKNKPSFRWLLEHGANPNLIPENDEGVLLWASKADDPEWLEMLLQHKANPNLKWKDARDGHLHQTQTPLGEAIGEARRKNLELLIKAGADVNYQKPSDEGGGTPAINAADRGWFEGVYVLLEAGADHRVRTKGIYDKTGGYDVTYEVVRRSPEIDSEAAKWRDKVLRLLQDRGADVEGARKKVKAERQ